MKSLVPTEVIQKKILFIGGWKIMPDSALATLYRAASKGLHEQISRGRELYGNE